MPTHSKAQLIMDHLIQVVFNKPSPNVIKKVLDQNMYVAPEDLLMETDETLDELKYLDDSGALEQIPRGASGLLKTFKPFVAY